MVIVDAFTHYVALNPVPHCNAYFAYTTLYEHWIAKFGLPEILVTDNGREFINKEIITLCHLYNIKHKPRTSHAPCTNGLVEGMNRSLRNILDVQPLRKGPYQIIAKPTDVTYKITDSDQKEIVQHRNNLLPYYPKEYALRE